MTRHRSSKIFTLLLLFCFVISGCATTKQYRPTFKVAGKEYRTFKKLDDEQALKIVIIYYNVPGETYEDGVARSLTLSKYIKMLEKRRSEYLQSSGVFELTYKEVEIKLWNDEDLVSVYDALAVKTAVYDYKPVSELSDKENALRIVQLTGMSELANELKNRKNTRDAWGVAAQVLTVALQVALAAL